MGRCIMFSRDISIGARTPGKANESRGPAHCTAASKTLLRAITCGKSNELPAPNRLRGSVMNSLMSIETKEEGAQLLA